MVFQNKQFEVTRMAPKRGGQPTSVWGLDGAGKGHTTVNAFATSVCSLQLDIGLHFLDLNSIAPIAFGSI